MTDVNSLIGARLRIEYFDQNELFASVLPRYATIIRQLQAEHNVDDWFLLKLDEPFDYPISRKDSSALEPLHCDQILIRSRWKGFRVGDGEPTSVFILLIRDEKHLTKEPIQIEEFFHVAWGMSHTLSV
jgi:hypothetical protein